MRPPRKTKVFVTVPICLHGAWRINVASTVLNAPLAVEVGVYVVRAFVKLREVLASNQQFAAKLMELE